MTYQKVQHIFFPYISERLTNYVISYQYQLSLHCLYIKNILLLNLQDIKSNPWPCRSLTLKFCYSNLNGPAAHGFTKLSLIE